MIASAHLVLLALLLGTGTGWPAEPGQPGLSTFELEEYDALPAMRVYPATADSQLKDFDELAARSLFDDPGTPVDSFIDRGGDCWILLDIRNAADDGDWVIWLRGQVQVLDLQVVSDPAAGPLRNGFKVAAPDRPMWAIGYAFPLVLQPGKRHRLVFRAYLAPRERLTATVLPRHLFARTNLWLTLLVLGTLGALFGLAVYNLFIFLSTRDRTHGWYSAYSLMCLAFWGSHYSIASLFNASGDLLLTTNGFLTVAAALLGARFSEVFLDLEHTAPRLRRIFQLLYVGLAIVLLAVFILPQPAFKLAAVAVGTPTVLAMIFAAFHALAAGNRRALFLAVGWLPFLVVLAFLPFQLLGLLPPSLSSKEVLFGLHAFEVLSMAFALADRIRLLEADKDAAQESALREVAMRLEESEKRRAAENYRAMAEEEAKRQRTRARTDALTGLWNRAAFIADGREVERKLKASSRLDAIVATLDVDGLKRLNDSRGHGTGDEMLVSLARELTRAVRAGDNIYRLGGDEFAVVAVGDGAVLSDALRKRIREAVKRVRADGFPEIDASVGSALYSEAGTSTTHVMELADHRMYEEKKAGREEVANDPTEASPGDAIESS